MSSEYCRLTILSRFTIVCLLYFSFLFTFCLQFVYISSAVCLQMFQLFVYIFSCLFTNIAQCSVAMLDYFETKHLATLNSYLFRLLTSMDLKFSSSISVEYMCINGSWRASTATILIKNLSNLPGMLKICFHWKMAKFFWILLIHLR